ncbi:hypothetical protein [Longibaculum muris]|uniref:hypothetical protein n=1 Tax=Longibaculum muris TaxID=1796628 RepID=UPI0022E98ACE|nr:hypothetical protein [Longibaculum muris]
MGLGLIIFGFFCLHFHYLDASVYSVELFPLSLGLLIILLGFLYAYHYTHQKAYLAFSLMSCLMIALTFIPYVRFIYLLGQTILYGSYLLFVIKQNKDYDYIKKLKLWSSLYFISGLCKAFCYQQRLYQFNTVASLFISVFVIATLWHLYKIKKQTHQETRPQLTRKHIPYYGYLVIIGVSISLIVIAHSYLIDFVENKNCYFEAYEIVSDKATVQYVVDYQAPYLHQSEVNLKNRPTVILKDHIKPKKAQIYIGDNIISQGYFHEIDDNLTYMEDILESHFAIHLYNHYLPQCRIVLDDVSYPAKLQKMNYQEYGYEDDFVKISRCYMSKDYILSYPRIEWKNQSIRLQSLSFVDNNDQEIEKLEYMNDRHFNEDYHDFRTIVFETSVYTSYQKSTRLKVVYKDQNQQIIEKEYVLEPYENSSS